MEVSGWGTYQLTLKNQIKDTEGAVESGSLDFDTFYLIDLNINYHYFDI